MSTVFQQRLFVLVIPIVLSFSFLSATTAFSGTFNQKIPQNLPLSAVSGTQPTLAILVQFSDKGNSTSPSQISTVFSSVNGYYAEDSYGTVSFAYSMTPSSSSWYQMPNTMEYYGADTSSSDNQLVHDALLAAYNAGVNLGNYKFALIVHAGNDKAMPPHSSGDIHSYTIQGFPFRVGLSTYTISSSVVAETDPLGVYTHESGHLLGLPDLYDVTQQIDPVNNFIGYWELMALGEWNPNNGFPTPAPGTYPSQMSVWSKMQLGFVSPARVVTVDSGNSTTVTVHDLELPTTGIQAIKIPIAYDSQGRLTYYLIEMRAKLGTYDQYLPFPSTYPNAGILIYKVNETISNGSGSVRLIDAHPGGDLSDAPFGPCSSPCVSNNIFSDATNFVKVIVTNTSPTAYTISVDRTASPQLLLQINAPSPGVLISVDGVNQTTDGSNELRLPVRYGPHTVFVQSQIPVSVGSTTVQLGLTNTFSSWSDGGSANPRGLTVVQDTVITALYRVTVEPSLSTTIAALIVLSVVVAAVTIHRHKQKTLQQQTPAQQTVPRPQQEPPSTTGPSARLVPGDDGLSGQAIQRDQNPDGS